MFSGTAHRDARDARDALADPSGLAAYLWSATSYKALREDAMAAERWNRLHPGAEAHVPYVTKVLSEGDGPVVAVSDFMRAVPDQVARWVPRPYVSLGTDGFGRSDTREQLRRYFEVDEGHVVVATLTQLAAQGAVPEDHIVDALRRYEIDPEAVVPWSG